MSLRPCETCRRHVHSVECPFCAKARRTSPMSVALAITAASLIGCTKDPEPTAPTTPATTTTTDMVDVAPPTEPTPDPVAVTPTPAPEPTSQPVATTTPTTAPTTTPVATAKPQPVLPRPDRPIVARYGVAPQFRE